MSAATTPTPDPWRQPPRPPGAGYRPHRRPTAEALTGTTVLEALGPELDELHAATGAPVTVRRPWLATWAKAHPASDPWAVVVRDPATGRLDGAALLGAAEGPRGPEVGALGHGRNDRSRLPVRSPAAATRLAHALVESLTGLAGPWTLRLEQLPAGDPVAAELARLLPTVRVVPAAPIPLVRFGTGDRPEGDDGAPPDQAPAATDDEPADSLDRYLGKGMRKQLRRARRRLEQDGLDLAYDVAGDEASVLALLDAVERIHRQRDLDVRGRSDLDAPGAAEFWREVIATHAGCGQVEISTLRLSGALAAYVVALTDGAAYRVLDGRFATEWADASPGRLLEAATVERALHGPHWDELDWMNSVASEKLVAYNAFEETEHLVGCSPRAVRGPVVLTDEAAGRPTADLALAELTATG